MSDTGATLAALLSGSWRREPDAPPDPPALPAQHLVDGGVAALAWNRLRRSGARAPELEGAWQFQAAREAAFPRFVSSVIERLHAAGIRPILAKGWALARAYPVRGSRPCGDVDLYVDAREVTPARAHIAGPAGAPLVDLHEGCSDLSDVGFDAVRAAAVTVRAGETDVFVPAPEHHLRLVALHALRHGLARPLMLVDVAVLLEGAGASFDWDRFRRGAPRRSDAAICVLELAADLLGARVPATRPWPRRRAPRWLRDETLRAWGHGFAVRTPIAAIAARGTTGELLRALRARWPNGIEATMGVNGSFGSAPRLPYQVAECLRRTIRFAMR